MTIALVVLAGQVRAQTSALRRPMSGAPATVTAFVDVAVIPMDTERVLLNQTVLVEGGRITVLAPSAKVKVPAGATRIDGRGKYLLPGLADMHVHLDHTAQDSVSLERFLGHFVANGVTTIRDMTHLSPAPRNLQFKALAAAGTLVSPRLYTSGAWGPTQPRLDSVAVYVAAYKAAGYDHIKPYEESGVVFDSLLAVARRLGIPLAGHMSNALERVLAAGAYRSIEHMMGYTANEAKLPTQVTATVRAGVWNTPTLALYEKNVYPGSKNSAFFATLVKNHQQIIRALHAAGAGLLVGSDITDLTNGWASPSAVHYELGALVRAGLTPYEALVAGTRNVAAYFGTLDSIGTAAVGKRADLVLLSGNPLEDVRHTREPAGVMLGGRWLDRAALDRHLTASPSAKTARALDWFFREMAVGLSPSLSEAQYTAIAPHRVALRAQADSLASGGADPGGRGPLLQRMAAHFGVIRGVLVPEQLDAVDPLVRVWLRQQALHGDRVSVPDLGAP